MATGHHTSQFVTRYENLGVYLVGDSNETARLFFLQNKPRHRLWRHATVTPRRTSGVVIRGRDPNSYTAICRVVNDGLYCIYWMHAVVVQYEESNDDDGLRTCWIIDLVSRVCLLQVIATLVHQLNCG